MKLNLKNEDGFTLIEALIALMLSTLIIGLLSGGILQTRKMEKEIVSNAQNIQTSTEKIMGDRQIEWHLFLHQLERYLQGTKNPQVRGNFMQVDEWDESRGAYLKTQYDQVRTNRSNYARVKSGGNHRMLSEVNSIDLQQEGGWLSIEVIFSNLEKYKGKIWIESWLEEEEK